MSYPWRLALGDRLDELDPALATYVGELPDGSVGRGSGVFDVVGTRGRLELTSTGTDLRLGRYAYRGSFTYCVEAA